MLIFEIHMRILGKKHNELLNTLSDLELVERFKKSEDTHIVGEFFRRYQHIVLGVCIKYLKNVDKGNDATMHLFQELFEYLKKYEIKDFKSWMLTITRNYCLRVLKLDHHHIELNEITEKNNAVGFMENEDQLSLLREKENLLDRLSDAVEHLKPGQKECIQLFYLKSKSYQEVCDETGFEIKKVKSFIQNGKRNLKICMESNA